MALSTGGSVHESNEDQPLQPSQNLPPPEHFRLSIYGTRPSPGAPRPEVLLHCALHRPDPFKRPNRSLLELELVDDTVNPLTTAWVAPVEEGEEQDGKKSSVHTMGMDPSAEDILKSTVTLMKPLRALSKRRQGKDVEINMVQLVYQVEDQLRRVKDLEKFLSVRSGFAELPRGAPGLIPFLQITAGIFKELTGFDRAMVYQVRLEFPSRATAN